MDRKIDCEKIDCNRKIDCKKKSIDKKQILKEKSIVKSLGRKIDCKNCRL